MKPILLALFLPSLCLAATHDCGSDTRGSTTFQWCIDTPDRPSGEILWYFHPVFGNEQVWQKQEDNQMVRKIWSDRGVAQPTAISISLGSFWVLHRENHSYPDFVSLILPYMEAKAGGLHGRRLLWGFSMGGFNAAQLLLRDGNLFERVVLLSPAFLTISPFASKEEVDAYFTRNNLGAVGRFKVQTFLGLLKKNYKSPELWTANDPLELSRDGLPSGSKVYVSDGEQDDYGFHEGAELFTRQAPSRGARVEWESLKGGHKTTNPESIAKFLIP